MRVCLEALGRLPFATLQKADSERNLQPAKPAEIAGISGNDAAPLVDLQHDLIDCAC